MSDLTFSKTLANYYNLLFDVVNHHTLIFGKDKIINVLNINSGFRIISFFILMILLSDVTIVCSQTSYHIDIVAKTGDQFEDEGVFESLGWGPSINDFGDVAFTGRVRVPEQGPDTAKEGVFVRDADPVVIERRSRLVNSFYYNAVAQVSYLDTAFDFGEVVEINNQDQVVWLAESYDGLFAFILRLGSTASDFKIVAKKYYPRIDFPDLTAESPFSYLFPWVAVTNQIDQQSRVVFSGLLRSTSNTVLATPLDTENGGHNYAQDFNMSGAAPPGGAVNLFPQNTDNNYTLIRGGGLQTSPLLLFNDESFAGAWYLADEPDFIAIGEKSGVSDDGRLVSFMGHSSEKGIGIYGEMGSSFKIAGMSGDGILDPGELHYDENSDQLVDSDEDIGPFQPTATIAPFSPTPRVGINRLKVGSLTKYSVAYLANGKNVSDQLGPKGLYVNTVDISDTAHPKVSSPQLIVQIGDQIDGLSGAINDIKLYDPINNNGEVTFWVRTSENVQAILRAAPSPCLPIQAILHTIENNIFDLVAKKDMVVRIFRDTGIAGPVVSVDAMICVDELVDSCPPERLFQGQGILYPSGQEFTLDELRDASDSVNVFIKDEDADSLLNEGEHLFNVRVVSQDFGALPDWDYSFKGMFRESKRINIFVVPVVLPDDAGNLVGPEDSPEAGLDEKDASVLPGVADFIRAAYPVDEENVGLHVTRRLIFTETPNQRELFGSVKEFFMESVLKKDTFAKALYDQVGEESNFIVGVVNSNIGSNNAPLGTINGSSRLGFTYLRQDFPHAVVTLDRLPIDDPTITREGKIILGSMTAHEIGHLYGFTEDYCYVPPHINLVNFSHPANTDKLGTSAGYYLLHEEGAFDVGGLRPKLLARDLGLQEPADGEASAVFFHEAFADPIAEGPVYGFMGGSGRACVPAGLGQDKEGGGDIRAWIRASHYQHLYDELARSTEYETVMADFSPEDAERSVILLSGFVTQEEDAFFNPFVVAMTDSQFSRPAGSEYEITFRDGAGALLDTVGFELDFEIDLVTEGTVAVQEAPFSFVVDLPVGTQSIALSHEEQFLRTFIVSATPPSLDVTVSRIVEDELYVGWKVSDADGDPLVVSVVYSPNGVDRFLLATAVQKTELQRFVGNLPPADENSAVFLYVNDGFHSTEVAYPIEVVESCIGDMDNDNDVDGSDLALFADNPISIEFERMAPHFGRSNCP